MKFLFSYGIWLGAIASYLLLFFEPMHTYIPYAQNIILIYEIMCWIIFAILSVVTLLFALGAANIADLEKKGTPEQFTKLLETLKKPKLHYEISRYLHYVFIVFIGIFVGDMSMTLVLTANAVLFLTIKKLMNSILEEASHE